MHNLRTAFICLLFATQISAMELGQNSNKDITIPRQVETLFKLAVRCIAKHLKTYKEKQIICLSKEIKKELARQQYLVNGEYILGFKYKDFTFSLAELINHGKITISFEQEELEAVLLKIYPILPNAIHIIAIRNIFLEVKILISKSFDRRLKLPIQPKTLSTIHLFFKILN